MGNYTGVEIKQNQDGSFGLQGRDFDNGPFMTATYQWFAALPSSTSGVLFVAPRACIVQNITGRVEVAGTDAGAVTATVYKAASGTAIASGTALHSGTINLKGTAATNQVLTVSTTAATVLLAQGDCIGIAFTGVMTAAIGAVTVGITPA